MAADVVDPLEPVEVDDEQGEILPRPQAAGDGRLELLLEQAAVVEAGELVPRRRLLQLGEEDGVADRDRDDVAERAAEVDVGIVPDAILDVHDLHQPDRLPASHEREHEQGALPLALEERALGRVVVGIATRICTASCVSRTCRVRG